MNNTQLKAVNDLLEKAAEEIDEAARLDLSNAFYYGTDNHAVAIANARIVAANVALARAAVYTSKANALIAFASKQS